jgi:hypothetical protein
MKVVKYLSAGLVAAATILSLAQGSAFAAQSGVTPKAVNSSPPCWTTVSTSTQTIVYIGSNGDCTTDLLSGDVMGVVHVTAVSSTEWTVNVDDNNCDNIGDSWKAHKANGTQFADGDSNGCKSGASKYTITKSELATTSVNWWVLWGGYNSPAFSFPS